MMKPVDLSTADYYDHLAFASIDREDWSSLGPAFDSITNRPVSSLEEFEQLILEWNRLAAYVGDMSSLISVNASLDTTCEAAQGRKSRFITHIQPNLEIAGNCYAVKVLLLADQFELPAKYALMIKLLRAERDIFNPQNPALESSVSTLSQEYDNKMGALLVEVSGANLTPPQLHGPMNVPDRDTRKNIWEALWNERAAVGGQVDSIFSEQIQLRHRISRNAGFDNYRDYAFAKLRRFYYSADDAKRLHDAIAESVVPVAREMYARHRELLGVKTLMPWDIGPGRLFEISVKPYATSSPRIDSAEAIEALAGKILEFVDSDMGSQYREMQRRGEMNLASRKGKSAGAYQTDFPFKRRPFIFGNNTGVIDDLYTTLHEFGHAYHSLQCCNEPISAYREMPMESAELASMSCELMGHNHLEAFYSKEESSFIRSDKYEGIALFLCYMAQVDAFQHWLYENPGHSILERRKHWELLTDRFGPIIDWSGTEEFKGIYWQQQLHLFRHPFYYIEYGIAQLGALQVEANYRNDPVLAVVNWRKALSLGGSRPLPEMYSVAGIKFDFSRATLGPVAEFLRQSAGLSQC